MLASASANPTSLRLSLVSLLLAPERHGTGTPSPNHPTVDPDAPLRGLRVAVPRVFVDGGDGERLPSVSPAAAAAVGLATAWLRDSGATVYDHDGSYFHAGGALAAYTAAAGAAHTALHTPSPHSPVPGVEFGDQAGSLTHTLGMDDVHVEARAMGATFEEC